ncbi:hypothetical protein [Streptomyces sp. NPDC006334]|uniref:hypothetical protein n=1 Tax=Streptomyces sp. NPDC006334 TaxID=3156754 RepID=UPI0033A019D2
MILVGVYLAVVMTWTAALLGHPPALARMACHALTWAARQATRGRRQVPAKRAPSWAQKGGRR